MSRFELWWARGVRALGVVTGIIGTALAAGTSIGDFGLLVPLGAAVAVFAHLVVLSEGDQ